MRLWAILTFISWTIWFGLAAVILSLRGEHYDCEPVCWYTLNLYSSQTTLQEFFIAQQIPDSRQNGRYEWSRDGGDFTFLLTRDERLMRIDAGWMAPAARPALAEVLLWFPPPDGVLLEGEVVANLRRLTIYLTYVSEDQITILSVRRMNNDPQQFGQMRIRPDDRVLRISRYEGVPHAVNRLMDSGWQGFARYPVRQICC